MGRHREAARERGVSFCDIVVREFGGWALSPWFALGLMAFLGGGAALFAEVQRDSEVLTRPEWRTLAVTGYGMVLGGLATLCVRAFGALSARGRLRRGEGPRRAELLNVMAEGLSADRGTHEEFQTAIGGFQRRASQMLLSRMWPLVLASFIVPVLGLVASWEAASAMVMAGELSRAEMYSLVLKAISPPMIASVAGAFVLLLGVAVVDRLARSALDAWGRGVRLSEVINVITDDTPPDPLPGPSVQKGDVASAEPGTSHSRISVKSFEDGLEAFDSDR
jgi:hypothetical protein